MAVKLILFFSTGKISRLVDFSFGDENFAWRTVLPDRVILCKEGRLLEGGQLFYGELDILWKEV